MRALVIALAILAVGLAACPKDREPGFDPAKGLNTSPETRTAPGATPVRAEMPGQPVKPGKKLDRVGGHPRLDLRRVQKPRPYRKPGSRPVKPPRLFKGIQRAPKNP